MAKDSPIQFKGTSLKIIQAQLRTANLDDLHWALADLTGNAPDFFENDLAVLDFTGLDALPDAVDWAGLRQLLARSGLTRLVDVYRRTWLNERFIPDEVHANLPGSLWLANTGDGALAPDWQAYFSRNLERISQGDKDWPLVFYCRSDCWQGWNAARRAHALGYRNLYWYRDGIDAWQQAPHHQCMALSEYLP